MNQSSKGKKMHNETVHLQLKPFPIALVLRRETNEKYLRYYKERAHEGKKPSERHFFVSFLLKII